MNVTQELIENHNGIWGCNLHADMFFINDFSSLTYKMRPMPTLEQQYLQRIMQSIPGFGCRELVVESAGVDVTPAGNKMNGEIL